ncbi:MAG: DNA repair exonuclease [Candidatus Thermoplasmatota archaeon]|nr:DNA repair exonuclease [Candidatus Thermoplasmatota archaeon]
MVKFAHIADCHLGAFSRDQVLKEYNLEAFEKAIEISKNRDVDFIIIAGDLFHNPHPDMEIVDRAVKKLMDARKNGINIYSVYGSHDYKISQASLLDVLASADVFKKVVTYLEKDNVLEFEEDSSGVSITGLSGRKNRADISYFDELDFPEPKGESIFVFHSPIAELKPADIHEDRSLPLSLLPDNFSYYAGGHIHERIEHHDEKAIYYPGPTFGANYTDLERDQRGFYIVEDFEPEYISFDEPQFIKERINADGLKTDELRDEMDRLYEEDIEGDILLLKISGTLSEGVPSDIDFSEVRRRFRDKGFKTVFLNRRELEGKEIERIKVKEEKEEDVETRLLEDSSGESELSVNFQEELLSVLKSGQKDGETSTDYENRIWNGAWELIKRRDEYENGKDRLKEGENGDDQELETQEKVKKGKDGQISLTDFGGNQR